MLNSVERLNDEVVISSPEPEIEIIEKLNESKNPRKRIEIISDVALLPPTPFTDNAIQRPSMENAPESLQSKILKAINQAPAMTNQMANASSVLTAKITSNSISPVIAYSSPHRSSTSVTPGSLTKTSLQRARRILFPENETERSINVTQPSCPSSPMEQVTSEVRVDIHRIHIDPQPLESESNAIEVFPAIETIPVTVTPTKSSETLRNFIKSFNASSQRVAEHLKKYISETEQNALSVKHFWCEFSKSETQLDGSTGNSDERDLP